MVASIKERRTRILLTLFLLDKDKPHLLFSKNIQHVFSLPTDSPRSRGTIRQMLMDGIIVKHAEGLYQITEAGIKELSLSFPFVRFLVFSWDNLYRIISYEIPERKRQLRDSLRREISGWGLGPWHRSFWLTPHPITEDLSKLIKNTPWQEYVQAFEGRPVVGEVKILLEKVWQMSSLESSYRQIFKKWHEGLSDSLISKEEKMKRIVDEYVNILKLDPGLPKELVGPSWIGFEAWDIFQEMRKILIPS